MIRNRIQKDRKQRAFDFGRLCWNLSRKDLIENFKYLKEEMRAIYEGQKTINESINYDTN